MKKIALLIFAFGILFSVQAQEATNTKKLSRKEKKELRKKEEEKTKQHISQIVESRQFVFEASQIIDRNGNIYPANSNINFIIVDSNKVIFQLGSAARIGLNGVGGVTIEGSISRFDIKRNEKNGYYYITMKVDSKLGFYDMQMDISPLGNSGAKITVAKGGKIGYSGEIRSFKDSSIYQGTTF